MKCNENASMCIKNLLGISIVFLFSIVLTINLLPKDKALALSKSKNSENISQDIINVQETNETTSEPIIVEYEVAKTATVTSRSGDSFERDYNQIEEKSIPIEEVKISKDMDLTIRTGLSKQDFKTLISKLKQDKSGFFYENSDLIYDLCEKYEINEIFFCGLIAGESGWNIVSNHRSTYNYTSLMYNGRLKQFNSVADGLEQSAKALHNNYLTEGGSFYCGKTLNGVKTRYCPNSSTWVNLIYNCMSQMLQNV